MSGRGLPDGVRVVEHARHVDTRGSLTEVFRQNWNTGVTPVQWNIVHSAAGTLRGVHAHAVHQDYLLMVSGELHLGLHDLREDSPTAGLSRVYVMSEDRPEAIVIPTGVAHGFYFPGPATYLYAVSAYWGMDDELGCRWDDPELGLDWSPADPVISPRDQAAGSLADLRRAFETSRLRAAVA
jgi:dTDP-4-dehydrorhamnose 3,5-epimerase